ncbi:nucleoporin 58 [Homo sapiens]|uniref:Nucleoporin 58 n=1 Tax=Homo sapiens TaxID=9606 RepID=F8WCJ8_HUMAN|nr:nucleoporin 58 [Homo sapiens]
MSTGFSFGSGTLGSTTVAAGGTSTGGVFSFGTGASSSTTLLRLLSFVEQIFIGQIPMCKALF